jgi:hypothetical protein
MSQVASHSVTFFVLFSKRSPDWNPFTDFQVPSSGKI